MNKAKEKWPDDFSMQEYELNGQIEAYNKLDKLIKTNSKLPEFEVIYKNAKQKWDKDYGMVVYEINEQLEALNRLK